MKTERREPGLEEESNFGFEGGRERNMSVLYPRFILGHLASCLQHVFLFGRPLALPRPGLMRTAEAPHNGDCVRPLNDRLS